MMQLEALVLKLAHDPTVISQIEQEVNRLSSAPTIQPIAALESSQDHAVRLYMCKALEFRIKERIGRLDLEDEIQFTTRLLRTSPTQKVCEIYATLGLFCWPAAMPSFLSETVSLFESEQGYQVFLNFVEGVNCSTQIDEKRRSELKKAIGIVSDDIIKNFRDEYYEYIIRIMTELLKIIPKNFDFSIVFRHAPDAPNAAIDFISEAVQHVDPLSVLGVVDRMPPDPTLLKVLTEMKLSSVQDYQPAYRYAIRSLGEDQECFRASVEFWQKVFSEKTALSGRPKENLEAILEPLLIAITKTFLETDELPREDVEGKVFGFFNVVAKNYTDRAIEFVRRNERAIPKRIAAIFLNKVAKTECGLPCVPFETPYLRCLSAYLRNDPSTPSYIGMLNLSEKDEVRLVVQVLAKYELPHEQISALYERCGEGCLAANEIRAECSSRIGIHISFEGQWNMEKVVQYFYLLKKDRASYIRYKDQFFSLFVQSAPFDRCFSILSMIGEYPPLILESIYQKMDTYPYIELNCFNNDLLPGLPIKEPFLRREAARFVGDWNTVTEYKEFYQAMRSFLAVIEQQIEQPNMTDLLLEMLQVDCALMAQRVLSIFNNCNRGPFDNVKAVYFLLSAYNSPNLADVYAPISQGLSICLCQPDGPHAFSTVAGMSLEECSSMQAQMLKVPKKSAVALIRRFLKNFKGKVYNRLFESDKKVTKQNLFGKKQQSGDSDTTSITGLF